MTAGAQTEILVALDRVRVQFNKLVAVHNLSLELRAGDLLGLIGPNGAGKTTLLRAIAGLQALTAGRISVLGEQVLPGRNEFKRHAGFTADTPWVYEELIFTFISLTACLASVGYLMRMSYRTRSSASVLVVLWVAGVWVMPWLVAFGMMALSDADTAIRVAAAWNETSAIACFSPIGTLIGLWSDSEMHYVPGLVGQVILAVGVVTLFYTRPAPRELIVPVIGSPS